MTWLTKPMPGSVTACRMRWAWYAGARWLLEAVHWTGWRERCHGPAGAMPVGLSVVQSCALTLDGHMLRTSPPLQSSQTMVARNIAEPRPYE